MLFINRNKTTLVVFLTPLLSFLTFGIELALYKNKSPRSGKNNQEEKEFTMSNNKGEKGNFEALEERNPEYDAQTNSKNCGSEAHQTYHEDERKFDFLVQDMFLDHFFP